MDREGKCGCRWKNFSILKSIKGRKEDALILPDGERIPAGLLIGTLGVANPRSIVCWKVVQKSLTEVVIRVVKGIEYHPDDEKSLMVEFSRLTKNKLSVFVEYSMSIPGKSGIRKHKVFENLLNKDDVE